MFIVETELEKAERLLSKIESEEGLAKHSDDPVVRVSAMLDEIERSNNPDFIAKKAREEALQKWRDEPLPPKTLGAGAALSMSRERIETMAKLHGKGQSEADFKRGISQ